MIPKANTTLRAVERSIRLKPTYARRPPVARWTMSSTMSTLRMPNHTWSPSTSPTRPIRMSTTPKICANRLSTMSGEPPVRVAYVSRRKVYVLGHLVDAPLPTLIHPSAQKGNSPKFGSRILHSPSPTPLESSPPGTPHPRGFPGADLRLLRWMGILGSAETEDGDKFIKAVQCCRCQ